MSGANSNRLDFSGQTVLLAGDPRNISAAIVQALRRSDPM